MRLAILSPSFPPDVCGVGDYSFNLAHAFVQQGQEVGIWTSSLQAQASSPFTLFSVKRSWGLFAFLKILREARNQRPDAFIVQYTPYLYAPRTRGVHLLLPLYLSLFRWFFSVPILLVVHELHYPMHFSLRGMLLGIPHYLQFIGLIHVAHKIVFVYDAPRQLCQKRFSWIKNRFFMIPVGTNIHLRTSEPEMVEVLRQNKNDPILLHFGRAHPTHLLNYTFKVLRDAQNKWGTASIKLYFIGIDSAKLAGELEKARATDLARSVLALGFLSEQEASRWLARATLLLAPFLDGVSTRRTSVMAALAHQLPVVTTRAGSTQRSIPWEKFCAITPAESEEEYSRAALQLLSHPNQAQAMGEEGKKYFEDHFSWPVLSKSFFKMI
jgi:glycosyltransferase involved in cell wall biosynthesis